MALYDEFVIYSVVFNLKGNIDRESHKLYDRLLSFPNEKTKAIFKRNNYEDEVINKNIISITFFIGVCGS